MTRPAANEPPPSATPAPGTPPTAETVPLPFALRAVIVARTDAKTTAPPPTAPSDEQVAADRARRRAEGAARSKRLYAHLDLDGESS